jgi:hypothetical protein
LSSTALKAADPDVCSRDLRERRNNASASTASASREQEHSLGLVLHQSFRDDPELIAPIAVGASHTDVGAS